MLEIEKSATRSRTCCQCNDEIPAGEFHLTMWGWIDTSTNWKHFAHIRCVRPMCTKAHILNNPE